VLPFVLDCPVPFLPVAVSEGAEVWAVVESG